MASIKDTDRGFADLLKRAALSKGLVLTIGIHAKEGGEPEAGSDLTVAEIGTIHEFGGTNNHPPQRSFIRAWADSNETQNNDTIKKVALSVIKGRFTAQQGLDRVGLKFVAGVQNFINAGVAPPLAQSTADRKGSTKPLINTGQMKSSIRHKVTKEGGE